VSCDLFLCSFELQVLSCCMFMTWSVCLCPEAGHRSTISTEFNAHTVKPYAEIYARVVKIE
jgi:hypothetical protein